MIAKTKVPLHALKDYIQWLKIQSDISAVIMLAVGSK